MGRTLGLSPDHDSCRSSSQSMLSEDTSSLSTFSTLDEDSGKLSSDTAVKILLLAGLLEAIV